MEKKRMRNYVISSYLVFWAMVLGICGTASMVFHCRPVVMRILSNVCAWSPTIVLLCGIRYFSPETTIRQFYKKAFAGKVSILRLFLAALLTMGATVSTVFDSGKTVRIVLGARCVSALGIIFIFADDRTYRRGRGLERICQTVFE